MKAVKLTIQDFHIISSPYGGNNTTGCVSLTETTFSVGNLNPLFVIGFVHRPPPLCQRGKRSVPALAEVQAVRDALNRMHNTLTGSWSI